MVLAGKLAAPTGGVETEQFKVGKILCERIIPDLARNPKYLILYAHGGGYTTGGIDYARIIGAKLATATGFEVITFDYRLAPENRFPAPVDDGMTIWDYIMMKGYGGSQVLLAGDSAGGNLVLCMTQRILAKKRKGPRALILFSPWTDMTAVSESYQTYKEKDPILTYEYICAVRDVYVEEGMELSDPKLSPLFGSFKNFPPTLVQVGKNEVLYDDSANLVKKIQKAGGKALLDVEKDGWHVYQHAPLPMANRAMKRVSDFVSEEIYKY
ncbi:MAG: alpha/beta hydrolase [Pseudobutyrivibrio sp.]|nr:alpha/beta hydrolase [Pseudobutyrivibrio sp.]